MHGVRRCNPIQFATATATSKSPAPVVVVWVAADIDMVDWIGGDMGIQNFR